MNIHVAPTPHYRTAFIHMCCQGRTSGGLTVRPDAAKWLYWSIKREGSTVGDQDKIVQSLQCPNMTTILELWLSETGFIKKFSLVNSKIPLETERVRGSVLGKQCLDQILHPILRIYAGGRRICADRCHYPPHMF